ncbi:hypothetical protein [Paenibacillus alvei]|uniref:hypothetical protein n=1 Tax=Paenibacillus alvei TaxID=44250 RepID=UPI0018CED734|nr:hypothetical protein [Paenibacillus alvei]MCY9580511.1 hypothetical protein [Paenibacillus alvei]
MSAMSPAFAASTYILTKMRVSDVPDVTEYSVCDSTDTSLSIVNHLLTVYMVQTGSFLRHRLVERLSDIK